MSKSTHQAPVTQGRTIRWFARFYDASSWLMTCGQGAKQNKAIVEAAGVQPGDKVLDVGCGTGAQTLPATLVAGSGNVSAIDASPDMIEIARSKAKKQGLTIDFLVAPIEHLPFDSGRFDLVLSGYMLHHLPAEVMMKGFHEVRRVLKPGGRFVIVDFSADGSLMGWLVTLVGHGHTRQKTARLRAMLSDVGFERVETLDTKQPGTVLIKAS
jgi:ubiquinone/menaquinone biosynthesis C-methylase UbiE